MWTSRDFAHCSKKFIYFNIFNLQINWIWLIKYSRIYFIERIVKSSVLLIFVSDEQLVQLRDSLVPRLGKDEPGEERSKQVYHWNDEENSP